MLISLHKAINLREFKKTLPKTFSAQNKCAVAVSGGADSIALTFLLHEVLKQSFAEASLHTFTVDHGLRAESSQEARDVQKMLLSAGIMHQILKIPKIIGNSTTVEHNARISRYTALTKACHQHNIRNLYLAHHQDDQVETLILRLIGGSRWIGLTGIRQQAFNPISSIVRGSHDVVLCRPLLGLPKSRLIATCIDRGIPWFEDPSNTDPGLTARNAVRKILQSPDKLPMALNSSRLLGLANRLQMQYDQVRDTNSIAARKCDISLCVVSGSLSFSMKPIMQLNDLEAQVLLLRDLCAVVTPAENIKRDTIVRIVEALNSHQVSPEKCRLTAAGLTWTMSNNRCTLSRQPYIKKDIDESKLMMMNISDEWKLYDRRFWIKSRTRGSRERFLVRSLQESDMSNLWKTAKACGKHRQLSLALQKAIGKVRFTLPVVLTRDMARLVALPSAGLCFENGLTIDCHPNNAFLIDRLLKVGDSVSTRPL